MAIVGGGYWHVLFGGSGQTAATITTTVTATATGTLTTATYDGYQQQQMQALQQQQYQYAQQQRIRRYLTQIPPTPSPHPSDEANRRAYELLLAHLSPKQLEDVKRTGAFTVRGSCSGNNYVIFMHGLSFNIFGRLDVGRHPEGGSLMRFNGFTPLVDCRICCAPNQVVLCDGYYKYIPVHDMVLGQKLALECDEEAFLRVANFASMPGTMPA